MSLGRPYSTENNAAERKNGIGLAACPTPLLAGFQVCNTPIIRVSIREIWYLFGSAPHASRPRRTGGWRKLRMRAVLWEDYFAAISRCFLRLRYALTWQACVSYTRLAMPSNSVPHTGQVFVYTRRKDASRLAAAERSSSISRGKTACAAKELPATSFESLLSRPYADDPSRVSGGALLPSLAAVCPEPVERFCPVCPRQEGGS